MSTAILSHPTLSDSARLAPVTRIREWMPAAQPKPRLRITGRGRAVLAVLIAIPIALFAITAFDIDAVATPDHVTGEFTYISVAAGESLWDIAQYVAPEADPREVVADFVQLNALGSADVQPGERLAIPAEYAR